MESLDKGGRAATHFDSDVQRVTGGCSSGQLREAALWERADKLGYCKGTGSAVTLEIGIRISLNY